MNPLPAGYEMPLESLPLAALVLFVAVVILSLWGAAYGPQIWAWWRRR